MGEGGGDGFGGWVIGKRKEGECYIHCCLDKGLTWRGVCSEQGDGSFV